MSRSVVEALGTEARRLGFDAIGVTSPAPSEHLDFYRTWLGRGAHGEMGYLAREDAVARRERLSATMETVRSVVVVAHGYDQVDPPGVPGDPAIAVIARYARGRDYHQVVRSRLSSLHTWLEGAMSRSIQARSYVDTGPVLEREMGWRAGLGWFGKNTMLIHPRRGSYFFLGVLLLDVDLDTDSTFSGSHCGSCSRCVMACPTGALAGYDSDGAPVIDARRCISYLTIELKGPIPNELRPLMGNRVYGCDICQEVCPWNERFSQPATEAEYQPDGSLDGPSLLELTGRILAMSGKQFQRAFADSPISRTRRRGMLRNLCVALGNWGEDAAVPMLGRALSDSQILVRGHAAWALGQVGSPGALEGLRARLPHESDAWVLGEIGAALERF